MPYPPLPNGIQTARDPAAGQGASWHTFGSLAADGAFVPARVARIERSEMRGSRATRDVAPGFRLRSSGLQLPAQLGASRLAANGAFGLARVARIERSEMRGQQSNARRRCRISLALIRATAASAAWSPHASRLTALSCQRRSMRCDRNDSAK